MKEKLKQMLKDVNPSYEMVEHFHKRTQAHIARVQENAKKLADAFPGIGKDLLNQVNQHDASKFEEPEFTPYLFITWKYKCVDNCINFEVPQAITDAMHEATLHHIRHNKHHPEYHDPDFDEKSLSKENRDGVPEKMVNAQLMDRVSLAEMVCDWVAMSQEKAGNNDATGWANQNINKRWKFTEQQVNWIWEFHDFFQK